MNVHVPQIQAEREEVNRRKRAREAGVDVAPAAKVVKQGDGEPRQQKAKQAEKTDEEKTKSMYKHR